MKNLNQILFVMTAVLMAACGSSSTRDFTTSASGLNGGSGNLTSANSGNIYNLPLAPQQDAKIGGNGACPSGYSCIPSTTSLSFGTSHTLKVKVKPLPAPHLSGAPYQNWVFPYGCLSVKVTVNGVSQTTQTLRVEGVTQPASSQCANAPTSQILNFDNAMTGSAAVNVTMSDANYDNCRYYSPLNYGCSISAVFPSHEVAATLAIQTDGTYLE